MAFLGLFGNDKAMAATTYSGRESATDRAARKRRDRRRRSVAKNARQGEKWVDDEFDRLHHRGRWAR